MFRKISAIVVSAEKPAIVKTSVGAVGTWISAHEIQVYVGIATLIFVAMQIIVMIPKVRSTLRQMSADRERERERRRNDARFSEIKIGLNGDSEQKKRETRIDRIKRFFRGGKK
ncbi:MAG: hypothetical protein LBI35_00700 [Burkholderiales bacterium]|nr:hypothetical protein [Burkholderiales bacterium]